MTKTRIFSLFLALSLLFSVLALPCAAVNDPGNDPAAAQTDSSQDEAAAEEEPPADEETPADPENGDSTPADASDPVFSVDAAAAMLVEMNSGTIVYEKNADDKVYPASLTKIMTCMLALELCKDLAEEVTVTETALAGLDPELEAKYAHILPMLRDMAALAAALEQRRRLRGALDLESRECHVICDELGDPVDVQVRETGVSEALIESFMLSANECVAEHLFQLHAPAVYRVHEKPSEDKVATLRSMLAPLGYDLREADHFSLQKVLEKARDTPQAPAIHMMVLRSLMKARYDVENLGHFGLAAKFYCHFTSPIRRYPDLMVHRILTALLDGALEGRTRGKESAAAQRAAQQSSDREVAAMNAEREIEKCYLAEYMHQHLGETFSGAVSGVTRFGLFVALPNGVEGLLPAAALPDDDYTYDEVRMTLTGCRTKAVWSFGMPLEVVCAAADPGSGQIDFALPEGAAPARPVEARQAPVKPSRRSAKTGNKPGYRPPKRTKGRRKR